MSTLDKSVPDAGLVATLLDLNDVGSAGAVTDQSPAVFDLLTIRGNDRSKYHEGLLTIEVLTKNGQGGTPTSPGAAAKVQIYYAFSDWDIVADLGLLISDAPAVFSTVETKFELTLPNSSASTAAGVRVHKLSEPIIHGGRYLYVWYDRDAFAANALIDLTARLIRL